MTGECAGIAGATTEKRVNYSDLCLVSGIIEVNVA